jgi:hypothetical protein
MKAAAFSAVVLLAVAAGPSRAQSTSTLRGIDVYRSTVLSSDDAERLYGDRIREYVRLRNDHSPRTSEKAEELRLAIKAEVAAKPGVAFADLEFAEFFTSVDHAMYAVFDVVDAEDSSRLAFKPVPKGSLKDPDGLIAKWRRYMDIGERLSQRGEMSFERPNCPGFYCLWGGSEEIDGLQSAMRDGALKDGDELRSILLADKDGAKRADALFVLSYSSSGWAVLGLCHDALVDPDPRVRGAALQILSDLANHHPELPIALDRVLPRIDDPTSAVRGKAMGVLVPLAEKKAYRQSMYAWAPRLVALLKMHQPESRDLAYTLLGIISEQSYDRADVAAWEKWAKRAGKSWP